MNITARKIGNRKRIKPIYVMHEKGVLTSENSAVIDGLKELVNVTGTRIPIKDFGEWNQGDGDYESVRWYIAEAAKAGREGKGYGYQLNASNIISHLGLEPWKNQQDHYDVFICNSDMWDGTSRTNFIIGLASPGDSTTFSVKRFRELDEWMKNECIKTETMHEVGHVFGLIPYSRTKNVEQSLGKHCTNKCTMRQGLMVPQDWIKITKDRLDYGAFCDDCKKDLVEYFKGE